MTKRQTFSKAFKLEAVKLLEQHKSSKSINQGVRLVDLCVLSVTRLKCNTRISLNQRV